MKPALHTAWMLLALASLPATAQTSPSPHSDGVRGRLPDAEQIWKLNNGTTLTGKQVEATARVIVIQDTAGRRTTIARAQLATNAAPEKTTGPNLTDLNPETARLLTELDTRLRRLDDLRTAGTLDDARHREESVKLCDNFLTRMQVMHPSLTTGELRARLLTRLNRP